MKKENREILLINGTAKTVPWFEKEAEDVILFLFGRRERSMAGSCFKVPKKKLGNFGNFIRNSRIRNVKYAMPNRNPVGASAVNRSSIFSTFRIMRNGFFIFALLLCNLAAQAQQHPDTARKVNVIDTLKKDLLTAPDTVARLHSKTWALVPPIVLISYGAASFYIHPLRRFDRFIYDNAAEHDFVPKQVVENYLQYAPVIITYGVNLVGVHGKNTFVDRSLIYLLSQGMLELTVFGLKNATGRTRPNGANNYSFPSGHTANAFAGAEFMAQELSGKSWVYGLVGYAFATTTGVFRVYHQDHWFSDVVAGAGFGILATKGAYLLYPVIRNTLTKKDPAPGMDMPKHKKKKQAAMILMPSYSNGTAGINFAMVF